MKKILSFVLCCVLILCAVPICAGAYTDAAHENSTYSVSKDSYNAGETVVFNYENAVGPNGDWIAIYKDGYTTDDVVNYICWAYIEGTGSISFPGNGWHMQKVSETMKTWNNVTGDYTAYFYYVGSGNVLTTKKFSITSDKTELKLSKTQFYSDENISVSLIGCKNAKDYVGLYAKGGSEKAYMDYIYYKDCGGNATFPSGAATTRYHYPDNNKAGMLPAGEYDLVLYENDGYNELDRKTITVVDRTGSTDPYFTFVEESYTNKTPVTVQLHNCKNPKDWVAIYKKGTSGGSYLKYIYNSASTDGLCTFPCYDPGEYTMILYLNDGYTVLFKKDFTIGEVIDPTVKATKEVFYSDEFPSIEVTGCKKGDWIGLYKEGVERYMDWIYYEERKSDNTFTFPTPANQKRAYYESGVPGYLNPGNYILKIHDGTTSEVLGSSTFKVEDRVTNIIYVDSVNGSDTYKGTSSVFPAQSYAHAAEVLTGDDAMVYVTGAIDYTGAAARDGFTTVIGKYEATLVANGSIASDTSFINVRFDTDDTSIYDCGNKVIFAGTKFTKKLDFDVQNSVTVDNAECGTVYLSGTEFIAESSSADEIIISTKDNTANVKVYVGGNVGKITIADDAEFASCEIITKSETAPEFTGKTENVWAVNTTKDDDMYFTANVGEYGIASDKDKNVYAYADNGEAVYSEKAEAAAQEAPETHYILNEYSDFISYRKPLENTYNKLTRDKKLNVVFFGGSVTAGYGSSNAELYSWRGRTTEWLKENFKDAKLNIYNEAAGESGTYLGSFRLQRDVISHKPDLLFLEYSINDKYYGSSYEQAGLQYETIIREVKQALPECDIVTILVTDSGAVYDAMKGKLHTQAQAHEDMAVKYNIPTVKVGLALAASLPSDYDYNRDWINKIMKDTVHPLDAGYEIYYNVVHEFMVNSLLCTEYDGKKQPYDEIIPVVSNHLFDGRDSINPTQDVINASVNNGGKGFNFVNSSYDYLKGSGYIGYLNAPKSAAEEAILSIEFDGTEMSLLTNFYNESAIKVSVDGEEYFEKACEAHNPAKVVSGLTSGHHTIKIIPVFKSGSPDFHIGMIYTYDSAKETQKGTTFEYEDRKNGKLVLPAGIYHIEDAAEAVEIETLPVVEKDGFAFTGWLNTETDVLATGTLCDGKGIKAEYVETESFLTFDGVSIRTNKALTGTSADLSGLRFAANLSRSIDNDARFSVEEYGMVIIPSKVIGDERTAEDYEENAENSTKDIIGAEKLVIGGKFTYNEKNFNVGKVTAEKLFAEDDNSVTYTTCITNIASENFGRYYTAKAYIEYRDLYGNIHDAYSAPYRSSVYEVARKIMTVEEPETDIYKFAESIVSSIDGEIR